MPIADQPNPQPTSATRPPARSALSTSGIDGRYSWPSGPRNSGRFAAGLALAERPRRAGPSSLRRRCGTPRPSVSVCLSEADDEPDEGREVRQVERVGERGDVRRGQRVATGEGVGDPVVGHEDAGDGLLLQPLPGVALGGAGAGGQLRRRQRALGERPVVAQAVPEVDRLQVQGGEDGTEEAFDEGVGGRVSTISGGSRGWSWRSPQRVRCHRVWRTTGTKPARSTPARLWSENTPTCQRSGSRARRSRTWRAQ